MTVRRIPQSQGLGWGEVGGPQLDALTLLNGYPYPLTLEDVNAAALAPNLQWLSWQEWLRSAPPNPILEAFRQQQGVVGVLQVKGVVTMLRLTYPPKLNGTDALYQLEETEDDIPPSLLSIAYAATVAAQQGRLPSTAPFLGTFIVDEEDNHLRPMERRWNRKEITRWVEAHGITWLRTYPHPSVPLPAGAVNAARAVMELSRFLWEPEGMASILPEEPGTVLRASMLAALWGSTHRKVRIGEETYTGLSNEPKQRTASWLWLEYHALASRGIVRFPPEVQDWLRTVPAELPLAPTDRRLAQGIANSLVQEAEEEGVFAPYGQFVVPIPAPHPLQGETLTISAYPDRLWVRWRNWTFCWLPRRGRMVERLGIVIELPERNSDEIDVYFLLDATLAALWRDLRVAQEEALPSMQEVEVKETAEKKTERRRKGRRPQPRRMRLPRRLPVRGWGGEALTRRLRRAHGVRAHLRRLPQGWHASPETKAIAESYGVALPEGFTFVRPHVRGGRGQAETPDVHPKVEAVAARGLLTLCSFLGQTRQTKK